MITTHQGILDENDMFSVPRDAPVWHIAAHRANEDIQAKKWVVTVRKTEHATSLVAKHAPGSAQNTP